MTNIFEMVKFNADGLVPAITQDIRTDEVLMLAYMNEESLRKTLETGKAHYYSRSRQKLWLKGETSGHFQQVRSISVDCDGDTLLLKVNQTGAACHTGHRSCFFTRLDAEELKAGIRQEGASKVGQEGAAEEGQEDASKEGQYMQDMQYVAAEEGSGDKTLQNAILEALKVTPVQTLASAAGETAKAIGAQVLQEVFDVISDRLVHPKEGSYTNYLFTKGLDKILKKIGEEACEVVIASKNGEGNEIKAEIADLFYHVMVLLVERGMTLQDVYEELKQRE